LAQLGPIDGEAQIPTSRTTFPGRVDCKTQKNKELAENYGLAKMNSHFHLLFFSWQPDLMLFSKFAR
jgi:hypothetical protein